MILKSQEVFSAFTVTPQNYICIAPKQMKTSMPRYNGMKFQKVDRRDPKHFKRQEEQLWKLENVEAISPAFQEKIFSTQNSVQS